MAQLPGGQHMFAGAQNLTIHGGSYTSVVGNVTINTDERAGLNLLLANIAPGAFHDAAERGDPPKCHPRTRVAIRGELMQWIKDPQTYKQFITWLYGPAGSGKTAIAQSIAEACTTEGLLAASFFFGRLASGRNTSTHFIPTIAYQVSRNIPETQDTLLKAIENDPTIFYRSLSTQMQVLVVNPLTSVQLTSPSRIVVVDGVDECGPNDQAHKDLLRVLATAVDKLRDVPILFLVSSRPEYEIRTAFNKNPLTSFTKSLALDNKYQPDEDIKTYLESKFGEIQQAHLPSAVEPWPSQSDIDYLVAKASGQFIFVATVVKFIDNPRRNPKEQLKIILGLSYAGNSTPFALLDALYLFIFRSVADVGKVLEVLTMILLGEEIPELFMHRREELLGFDIRRAMVDMHALVFVPPADDISEPYLHHASLYDFLMDQSRSLELYIDADRGHASLCVSWLKVLGMPRESRLLLNSTAVTAFNYHCSNTSAQDEIVDALRHLDLSAALNKISTSTSFYDLYSPNWIEFFQCEDKENRHDVFLQLENVFDEFIEGRIAQYPPVLRTYIPILLCEWAVADHHLEGTRYTDICRILFHGISRSPEELKTFQSMDHRLLQLQGPDYDWHNGPNEYFEYIWDDENGTCKYFITDYEKERIKMLKIILGVICSKPGERNYQMIFRSFGDRALEDEGPQTTQHIYLQSDMLTSTCIKNLILRASSGKLLDPSFAYFLLERGVQYRNDVALQEARGGIAEASIEYIKKSGIPFLKHAHELGANQCAICDLCKDAIVVENTPSILLSACADARDVENGQSESPSSPFLMPVFQPNDGDCSVFLEPSNSSAMVQRNEFQPEPSNQKRAASFEPVEDCSPGKRRRRMDIASLLC